MLRCHDETNKLFMNGIANNFPAKNALNCRILHIQSKTFLKVIPSDHRSGMGRSPPDPTTSRAPPALGPRHQFPIGSPAFPLFLFYETTTDAQTTISKFRTPIFLSVQYCTKCEILNGFVLGAFLLQWCNVVTGIICQSKCAVCE